MSDYIDYSDRRVAGFCPMGCGESLTLATGGQIRCEYPLCPRPTAASEILADPQTGHIVELGVRDFSIIHPLRERLDGQLLECELNEYLQDLGGPPQPPGRYRVTGSGETWTWETPVR